MTRMSIIRRVALVAALAGAMAPADAAAQDNGGFDPSNFQALEYHYIGPSRGGRVTAVAGHPSHPYTFYMGGTGGGVFKTDDYGATWRPITDGQIATGSIGVIRVAPSDPDVVWVGTGTDGIRSNVIMGKGVYRSDDAGRTWRFMGLEDAGQIGRMEVHPDNPDIVWLAALGNPWGRNEERGVFKTTDGGRSWRKVLFTSDSVGAYGLKLHPTNPDIVYASLWRGERKPWTIISGMEASAGEDGIWKSTDGGESWRRLENGLPTGLIGKIDLTVTPADPARVYAVVETTDPDEGVYRSDDQGETWRLTSNQGGLMNRPFYYTNITADPTNADVVYVNNEGFYKSVDGGRTFERRPTPHGDNHDMWINPEDPDIIVQSNDGGANVTLDGGRTWSTQHNQPTAELYQVDVDTNFPYWLYAGQQDNSTIMVPSRPPAESAPGGASGLWHDIGGCETGPVVPKPGDPNVIYANCKGRFGLYDQRTGQERQYYVGAVNLYGVNPSELPFRFQRTVPIEVSPHDPNTVYHASQYVHRTRDGGITWETISPDLTAFRPERQVVSGGPITRDITGEEHYSVLYAVEASPLEPDVIYAGANDGPVHVTRDGGATWTDVTPPMPPEGRVNFIDVSPHDPAKVYVAAYRTLLGDFTPYAFRSEDYGRTWTSIAGGFRADEPVRVVREDPVREGLVFAGTEYGMHVSFDDGATWQPFQENLPVTPITDIDPAGHDLAISTMGRGFWIVPDLAPLRQLDASVVRAAAHLFRPSDTYRTRMGVRPSDDPAEPNYPPEGAIIDYVLRSATPDARLEILDARGNVLRAFEGGPAVTSEEAQAMRGPFSQQRGAPTIETGPGHHRFVWNLELEGPGGSPRGGPMVVPGDYRVRLTAAGRSQEQALRIMMDPRVAETGITVADLQKQFDLSMRVRDALAEAQKVAGDVESAQERARSAEARQALEALQRLERTLVTNPAISSYPQPMLIAQLQYLYSMITRADQEPGNDAYQRYTELRAALDEVIQELRRVERSVTQ